MTYWYIIWSPGGATIANKSLCLKANESCSEKIWNSGSDPGPIHKFFSEEICGSDPEFQKIFQKRTAPVWRDEVV